ncbi:putative NusB antitermination factor [Magnetofaba australis IT-1]|uniref:Transcription antitermination protein NusB n=1 Tax=Magnetofaba australis IT-1 TaxID=1434232 RepID=A0A1Y2K7U4_9PROT|nr:putative NusB antitermination factor [Magnetofaba australis IT-1]
MALQALYACEVAGTPVDRAAREAADDRNAEGADMEYYHQLMPAVWNRREMLDGWVIRAVDNWTPERVSVIERNILRVGAHEILYEPATPLNVIINEAIEVAKRFGSEQSGRFVNGVLDRVAALIRDADAAPYRQWGE